MTDLNGSYFPIFSTTVAKQKKKERRFDRPLWPLPLTTMHKSREPKRLSKEDIENTMNFIYEDDWKTFACCTYLLDHMDELKNEDSKLVWTDKYRPTRVKGLLGSLENHTYLKDWLEKLKVRPVSTTVTEKKRKSKKDKDGDDELYNLIVLVGDHGSGKTASVMTVAKETGYAISEMNSSSRRTGKDVTDTLGGMTESHLVRFDSHTQKRKFEGEKIVLRDTVKKKKTFDMMQHFKKLSTEPEKEEENKPIVKKENTIQSFFDKTREKMKKMEIEKKLKNQPKQSLILLEEVDLLYEEDKGFWPSVYELNRKSKRPIILTCNEQSFIPFDNLYIQDVIYYDLPEREPLACYIQLICLIENHFIEPKDISFICSYFDYDTRKILENLQLWLNESADERFYFPYLFAHLVGFFDLIQQPNSYKLADRLQGLTTKKQDLCKQYYFETIVSETDDENIGMDTICSLMESASFADAYIDLTEKQRHQLYDIDQYGKQDMYNADLKMIFKEPGDFDHWEKSQTIENSIMILNMSSIVNSKSWRNPITIWSSQWEKLSYDRSRYFERVQSILYPSLLDSPTSRNIVMMEYLPEIRSLCKYDQGVAGKGRQRRTRKRIRYLDIDQESREYIDWERKA